MDDLTAGLNQILSDPQSIAQIQAIMGSLGLGNEQQNTQTNQNTQTPPTQNTAPNIGGMGEADIMAMMANLAPLLGQIKQEDSSTRLLNALIPMLSDKRQEKATQAIRILQLMKLFPLLKDSGMLKNFFGGLF